MPVEMVQFLLKRLLKQNSCCGYVPHFHLLLVVTKLLTTKLIHVMLKSWKFERLESNILPLTPQTW